MKTFKRIALYIVIFISIFIFFLFSTGGEFRRVYSPDGQYSVYGSSYNYELFAFSFPGQSGDAGGKIFLYDEIEEKVINSGDIAMMSLTNEMEWYEDHAYCKASDYPNAADPWILPRKITFPEKGIDTIAPSDTMHLGMLNQFLEYTSEEELNAIYAPHLGRGYIHYSEEEVKEPISILYPGADNAVEFYWRDTINMKDLYKIKVWGSKVEIGWKTEEGFFLGQTLQQIEFLNEGSFSFLGFGWDNGGKIMEWHAGKLTETTCRIRLSIENPEQFDEREKTKLQGDKLITSNLVFAQKINPVVSSIELFKDAADGFR